MKFEVKTIKLKKKMDVLINSKSESEKDLIPKNNELTIIKDRFRDVRKNGEINPFDFHDIPQDNEIDSNNFLNIAENIVVVYENDQIFEVTTDAIRDDTPSILKSYLKINDGDRSQINRFYKDVDQTSESIDKMVDKHDDSLKFCFQVE